jgi:hypothetical protein
MAERADATATDTESGSRGGTCSRTQASSVAASGAMPGEAGNMRGSMACRLSMTSNRVSIVVPCFA